MITNIVLLSTCLITNINYTEFIFDREQPTNGYMAYGRSLNHITIYRQSEIGFMDGTNKIVIEHPVTLVTNTTAQ